MGMDLSQKVNVITEDEYKQLQEGKKLIDTYSLDLIDANDIDNLYKQLAFDIIQAMTTSDGGKLSLTIIKETSQQTLLQYFQDNWQDLINELNLYDSILIPEEIEDNHYITFQAWKDYDDVADYAEVKNVVPIDMNGIKVYVLVEARYW